MFEEEIAFHKAALEAVLDRATDMLKFVQGAYLRAMGWEQRNFDLWRHAERDIGAYGVELAIRLTREWKDLVVPSEPDLLPCPCCGGTPDYVRYEPNLPDAAEGWYIKCRLCEMIRTSAPMEGCTKQSAAACWNKRHTPLASSAARS